MVIGANHAVGWRRVGVAGGNRAVSVPRALDAVTDAEFIRALRGGVSPEPLSVTGGSSSPLAGDVTVAGIQAPMCLWLGLAAIGAAVVYVFAKGGK